MTAANRLARYRAQAQKHNEQYGNGKPGCTVTWQDCQRWDPTRPGGSRYRPNSVRGPAGQIYSDRLEQYGTAVDAPRSHGRSVLDNTGYYADHYYSDTIRPYVMRLRCPRGTLYIPATDCTGWDGTVHYLADAELAPKGADEDTHERAARDAWHAAHGRAEHEAEAAREDAARATAEQDIAEARETIQTARAQVLQLCRQSRPWRRHRGQQATLPGIPDPLQTGNSADVAELGALCDAVRETVRRRLAEIAEARDVIQARTSDPWSAVAEY